MAEETPSPDVKDPASVNPSQPIESLNEATNIVSNIPSEPTTEVTIRNDMPKENPTLSTCSNLKGSLRGYLNLISHNRNYRLYFLSHMCQHTGDWFVRIAALLTVERLAPGNSTALAGLIVAKMLPEVVITPIGGVIADSFDRRRMMIFYDCLSGLITLGFIVAVTVKSLVLLYVASVMRAVIFSLYEPVTKSIVPMVVTDKMDLQRAVTLNSVAWSGMLMLGGLVAGYASATIGVEACYAIDSLTYFISAIVMGGVTGQYTAVPDSSSPSKTDDDNKKPTSPFHPIKTFINMTNELLRYLWTCGFGALVFMKASGSMIWGASDVLNVSFAHVDGDEGATSRRIGVLYSCVGLGCLVGPIVVNSVVNVERPASVQLSCIGAMLVMMTGWIGISNAPSFELICAFTSVRTFGSAIIWVNSTLLLQTLSAKEKLGRVMGFEFAIALGTESLIAFITGRLEDAGVTNHAISMMAATIAGSLCTLWSIYHLYGGAAANSCFNRNTSEIKKKLMDDDTVEGTPIEGSNVHGALV